MTDLLMDTKTEVKARTRANAALYDMNHNRYHEGLGLALIDDILKSNGFTGMEEAIYCGRDGQVHEQVGRRTWLTMSWHKMESGKYEIVAYLS